MEIPTVIEKTHVIEFTEKEIKEILRSAAKQMIRVANEPICDHEISILGKVIEKCSAVSKK